LFVLADDLGWGNVGWTRNGDDADGEVRTPVMDDLVAQGIELTRAYAWGLCAPSRAAMQSGRHPLHVNVENVDVMNYNPDDPVSGYQGIPLGMVTLPQLLAPAGCEWMLSHLLLCELNCAVEHSVTLTYLVVLRGYADRSYFYGKWFVA
jgi:arylsulfatase A-like enzyme